MTLRNSIPCRYCGRLLVPGGALASHEKSCADGGTKRRKRSQYREVFLAHNGPGPYACYFECSNPVMFEELVVHHKDHDHTNNSLDNLVPAHRLCHNGHHLRALWADSPEKMLDSESRGHRTPHSEETRRKISEGHKEKGLRPSDEARALAREAWKGSTHSDEAKKKMSEYATNRSEEHREKLRQANLGKKKSPEAREKMRQAALERHRKAREERDAK